MARRAAQPAGMQRVILVVACRRCGGWPVPEQRAVTHCQARPDRVRRRQTASSMTAGMFARASAPHIMNSRFLLTFFANSPQASRPPRAARHPHAAHAWPLASMPASPPAQTPRSNVAFLLHQRALLARLARLCRDSLFAQPAPQPQPQLSTQLQTQHSASTLASAQHCLLRPSPGRPEQRCPAGRAASRRAVLRRRLHTRALPAHACRDSSRGAPR